VGSEVNVAVDVQGGIKAKVKVHVDGVHDGERRLTLPV
jgi:hypothetical protein